MSGQNRAVSDHGALMDSMYRGQRHIYDLTRKYYLFGRDRLIAGLALPHGGTVLEIGCGTGRNLDQIRRHWPEARLYGLDISSEMLKSARACLGRDAVLALGDAADFSATALFGRGQFDRVVLSFCLSMIPPWQATLAQALSLLARNGSLHIVDFGRMQTMPGLLRRPLRAWLAHFHVTPRADLDETAVRLAREHGLSCQIRQGPGGYYNLITISAGQATTASD
jgi:S-adenosylmethionine-diacylgycerolhomoserine-N-methlytransferase